MKPRKPVWGDLIFIAHHLPEGREDRLPVYYRGHGSRAGLVASSSITSPDGRLPERSRDDFEWLDGTKVWPDRDK